MKRIVIHLFVLLLSSTLLANTAETIFPSDIKSVTVFRKGAQVFRLGEGRVPAGQSILKLSGLSAHLAPASIQFNATGEFTILSVNFQRNYINPLENSPEAKALQNQIEQLQEQIHLEEVDRQVLQEEESLLIANKQIGGQQNGVQLEDLQAIAQYYRERLKAIKLELLTVEKTVKDLKKEQEKLRRQLAEMSTRMGQKASGEVWVTVTAERAVNTKFQLNYLVPNAGWSPSYDVRVADIGVDVQLDLKGNVYQSSGESWEGVSLSLSTGIPTESGVKPDLQTWWLAPYQAVVRYQGRSEKGRVYQYNQAVEADALLDEESAPAAPPPPPPPPAAYVSVEQFERTTTREYLISLPYDIPSDGKPYTVAMEEYNLPAEYQYYIAPKLDKDAFLTAKVSGWDEYNLLSGSANLFFEGSFLGKTQLNVQQTTDTLELSLGRDKGIIVKRTKDEQFKDKQFIGNKVTQKTGWKIELRNTKSKAISILVEDQIPLSTTDEIEVKLNNARGASVNEETGKLRWQLTLPAGKSEILRFQYEVKYPKKMSLVLE